MDVRELTDRSHDDAIFTDVAWHGYAYFDAIESALPSTFEFGEGVADSQRCWVGYLPSTDEFLAGYDLWLQASDDGGDDEMAGGLVTWRLTIENGALVATPVKSERLPQSIYDGDALDQIRARHPDHVEIDID